MMLLPDHCLQGVLVCHHTTVMAYAAYLRPGPAQFRGASGGEVGQYLPDSYFRIRRDVTISIAQLTL